MSGNRMIIRPRFCINSLSLFYPITFLVCSVYSRNIPSSAYSTMQGYMDRSHTAQSRKSYEETFRETCSSDFSPYNIFQVLYSYSCFDCQRFSGKAKNYFRDTYVSLAKANFESPMERVLLFRRSFAL